MTAIPDETPSSPSDSLAPTRNTAVWPHHSLDDDTEVPSNSDYTADSMPPPPSAPSVVVLFEEVLWVLSGRPRSRSETSRLTVRLVGLFFRSHALFCSSSWWILVRRFSLRPGFEKVPSVDGFDLHLNQVDPPPVLARSLSADLFIVRFAFCPSDQSVPKVCLTESPDAHAPDLSLSHRQPQLHRLGTSRETTNHHLPPSPGFDRQWEFYCSCPYRVRFHFYLW